MFKVKKTGNNYSYKIQSNELIEALNILLKFYPKTTKVISLTGGGKMSIAGLIKFAKTQTNYVVLDIPVIEYMNKLYKDRNK